MNNEFKTPLVTSDTLAPMTLGQSSSNQSVPQQNWNGRSVNPAPSSQTVVSPEAVLLALQLLSNPQNAQLLNQALQQQSEESIKLNEGTYVGPVKDGKPHGKGVLTYLSEDHLQREKYEGQFVNGVRQGFGILTYQKGIGRYEGEFDKDKFNGKGLLTHNGVRWQGNFFDGKLHGIGTYVAADGTRWEGMFQNGKLNGQAREIWVNGSFYTGNFVDDKQHGFGEWYWPNGRLRLRGNFVNGLIQGRGTLGMENGSRVEGLFKDGAIAQGQCCVIL